MDQQLGFLSAVDLTVVAEVFASHPEVRWITGAPCVAGADGVLRSTGSANVNRYDFLSRRRMTIQQESTFWRRSLWDAVGGLDSSLRYAADLDLWTRFFGCAELYSVSWALAAFRVHEDRLGRPANGGYSSETARPIQMMLDAAKPRDRHRARFVSLAHRIAGRLGSPLLEACPGCGWYRHPRISYDFDEGGWKVHTQRRVGERRQPSLARL